MIKTARRKRWLAIATAIGLTAGVWAAGPATADQPGDPLVCAELLIIGARGSGQPALSADTEGFEGFGRQVFMAIEDLEERVDALRVRRIALQYPARDTTWIATNPKSFFAGIELGVSETRMLLETRARRCPDEMIALVGFSQGAMVMHRVVDDLFFATDGASARIFNRIATAILIADGDRSPKEQSARYGSAGRGKGVATVFNKISKTRPHTLPDMPSEFTHSICNFHDVVCDFSALRHALGPGPASFVAGGVVHDTSYDDGNLIRKAVGASLPRVDSMIARTWATCTKVKQALPALASTLRSLPPISGSVAGSEFDIGFDALTPGGRYALVSVIDPATDDGYWYQVTGSRVTARGTLDPDTGDPSGDAWLTSPSAWATGVTSGSGLTLSDCSDEE